jgi:hypothetical protein
VVDFFAEAIVLRPTERQNIKWLSITTGSSMICHVLAAAEISWLQMLDWVFHALCWECSNNIFERKNQSQLFIKVCQIKMFVNKFTAC